jgi:large subunit ribosomal protein L9
MKLILREDVENLGKGGELVEVRPGYGRNFLIPRGLAVLANAKNVKELEHQKKVAEAKAAKLKQSAEAVAKRLAETPIRLTRKVGEQDKLYGSVTALDVVEALAARGLQIDRRSVDLAEPLKTVGDHEVPVKLHREVVGKVKVKMPRSRPRHSPLRRGVPEGRFREGPALRLSGSGVSPPAGTPAPGTAPRG